MRENPKPFELYRHFKGNLYQVLTIAKDSETMEDVVVYQALYGDYAVYVRPLAMFMSTVDKEKYPDVRAVYRFEKVGEQLAKQTELAHEEVKKAVRNDTILKKEEMKQETASTKEQKMEEDAENAINPAVLEFLEAETYEEKLRILVPLRDAITDEMITTMAIATDLEVGEGPIKERYEQLKNCLVTLEKYECNRLR